MDFEWEDRLRYGLTMKPREWRRQCKETSSSTHRHRMIDEMGAETYVGSDIRKRGVWTESSKVIEEQFGHRRRTSCGRSPARNAGKFYGLMR